MPEMNVFSNSELLVGLAARLEHDPTFMASVLRRFRSQERMAIEGLLDLLGTTREKLLLLALCRRPDTESTDFAQQVRQVASFTQIDPFRIADIIRQVEALEAMAQTPQASDENVKKVNPQFGYGLLAAARDRVETEDNGSDQENQDPIDAENESP